MCRHGFLRQQPRRKLGHGDIALSLDPSGQRFKMGGKPDGRRPGDLAAPAPTIPSAICAAPTGSPSTALPQTDAAPPGKTDPAQSYH